MTTTAERTLWQRFALGLKEPTVLRLLLVAAAIAACAGLAHWARASLKPPAKERPDRDFRNLPRVLGGWVGVDRELDPKVFEKIGANYVVERVYRNGPHRVSLHLAVFLNNPDEGISHSPMNCYFAEGYRRIVSKRTSLGLADEPDMKMDLTTWDKNQQQVLVGYWFKLGDHLLFNKWDMAWARFQLSGQSAWPDLVKVLIHYAPSQGHAPTEQDAQRIREFAAMIEQWISAPDDRTALERIGSSAARGAEEGPGAAPALPESARPADGAVPAADDQHARRGIPFIRGGSAGNVARSPTMRVSVA